MKLCLLDADYIDENEKSVVRLFCKDTNGKIIICLDYNFEPYYILSDQRKENEVKRVKNIKSIKIKRVEKNNF